MAAALSRWWARCGQATTTSPTTSSSWGQASAPTRTRSRTQSIAVSLTATVHAPQRDSKSCAGGWLECHSSLSGGALNCVGTSHTWLPHPSWFGRNRTRANATPMFYLLSSCRTVAGRWLGGKFVSVWSFSNANTPKIQLVTIRPTVGTT